MRIGLLVGLMALSLLGWAKEPYPTGEHVLNIASVSFQSGSQQFRVDSNRVDLPLYRSDALITFLQFDANGNERHRLDQSSYQDNNGQWHGVAAAYDQTGIAKPFGRIYGMSQPLFYLPGESVLIKVVDADHNLDAARRDTLEVTITSPSGDRERLRLVETAPDSGIFVGSIPLTDASLQAKDGRLFVRDGETIQARYEDESKTYETQALIGTRQRIWLTKTADRDEVAIGGIVRYTIEVHNDGSKAVRNIRIDDRLPLGCKYVAGTARLNDRRVNVQISRDGRALAFDVDRLDAGSVLTVALAVRVGAAPRGIVRNRAWVALLASGHTSQVRISNVATATTRIIEELMRTKGVIVGTVYACENFRKGIGIQGVRLYMENGAYVVTDEYGRYHFEGVERGLHVVQIDEANLPKGYKIAQRKRRSIRHAGREISQFVRMHNGVLKRVDFCLDGPVPKKPEPLKPHSDANVSKQTETSDRPVAVAVTPANPADDSNASSDPHPSLQDLEEERNADIEYYGGAPSQAGMGEVYIEPGTENDDEEVLDENATEQTEGLTEENTTTATRNEPPSVPSALSESSDDDEEVLEDDEEEDEGGEEFIPTLSSDGRLVQEAKPAPKRTRPIANRTSMTHALPGESIRRFEAPQPSVDAGNQRRRRIHAFEMPQYDEANLTQVDGSGEILWPPEGYVPRLPSTEIAVGHRKGLKAVVILNGYEVNVRNYAGKIASPTSDNVIAIYKGVDLLPRTNRIRVQFIDGSGKVVKELQRTIHVTGRPVYVEYVPEKSTPVADGKHSPIIAVRLYDADGYPLRQGVTGTFGIDEPYRSQAAIDEILRNPLGGANIGENRYVVGKDGIAYIKLQPTTQAGMVTLHFNILDRDEVVRAWLKPSARDWIVVGYAQGRVGYAFDSGSKDSANDAGEESGATFNGRVAFFAKGSVEKWLLTMAYDSGKRTDELPFFNEIDPNAYYTLYNDNTVTSYEAPSRRKLYFKAEKDRFSVLFGDFRTDMTETELTRYNRTFTGIKSEYFGDSVEGHVFVTQTDQLFIKDELRGDGTSGYYNLTHRNIVEFSEKIEIQVRDRYHPDRLIKRLSLQRYKDYEIDYDRGRVYFKAPIFATDANFNPQYVVVDYEIEGKDGSAYTYGGRIKGKWLRNRLQVGGTYVSEDNVAKQSTLMGSDVTMRFARTTTLKAEIARSETTAEGNTTSATAKFFELEHLADNLYVRAYFREQEAGFGLGQISGGLGGTRMFGVDLSRTYDNRINLIASAYRNHDLATGNDQDVIEGRFAVEETFWGAYAGYRYAAATTTPAAHQLLIGGSYWMFDKRMRLYASHDQTFGQDKDKLFPTKTAVGAEYAVTNNTSFFATYEWQRGDVDRKQGRIGLRTIPWSGMTVEMTTLSEGGTDATRLYNTVSMRQTYQLNDRWSLSGGYERGTLIQGAFGDNQEDFDALYAGATYRDDDWVGMGHVEYRLSDSETKYNVNLGIYRQLNDTTALAFSGDYNRVDAEQNASNGSEDLDLRFSLAYRPLDANVTVLDRLDWIVQRDGLTASSIGTDKMINNLAINYSFDDDAEAALQYGVKYVKDSVEGYDYRGWTHYLGADAWYGLDDRWLVGAHGGILYAQTADNMDYTGGVYAGYNVYTNMFLLVGYNFTGFRDRDFSLQNYNLQGPYIEFRMKFDQYNLKQMLGFVSPRSDKEVEDSDDH